MATLKKYDFTGKEIGSENVDDNLLVKKANSQMVKDYIVALCKNARQWSANTKTRSEVNKVKQKASAGTSLHLSFCNQAHPCLEELTYVDSALSDEIS